MSSVVPGFMIHDVNRSSTRVHARPGGNSQMGGILPGYYDVSEKQKLHEEEQTRQDKLSQIQKDYNVHKSVPQQQNSAYSSQSSSPYGYDSYEDARSSYDQKENQKAYNAAPSPAAAAGVSRSKPSVNTHNNIFQTDMLQQSEPSRKSRFSGRSNHSSDIFNTKGDQMDDTTQRGGGRAPVRQQQQQQQQQVYNQHRQHEEYIQERVQPPRQQYSNPIYGGYAEDQARPQQLQRAQQQPQQQQQQQAHTSIRMHQPPGGRSSGPLW